MWKSLMKFHPAVTSPMLGTPGGYRGGEVSALNDNTILAQWHTAGTTARARLTKQGWRGSEEDAGFLLYSLQPRNQRTRIGFYNLNIVVQRPQWRNSATPIQSMIPDVFSACWTWRVCCGYSLSKLKICRNLWIHVAGRLSPPIMESCRIWFCC